MDFRKIIKSVIFCSMALKAHSQEINKSSLDKGLVFLNDHIQTLERKGYMINGVLVRHIQGDLKFYTFDFDQSDTIFAEGYIIDGRGITSLENGPLMIILEE